jgi:RNA polymerase sigma-70 factor, ECF subfamily
MSRTPQQEVTTILADIEAGQADAESRLVEVVYNELHGLAGQLMRHERPDHTLQPTALVNEALLRLLDADALKSLRNRGHFFSAAVRAMRQVLVEHARGKHAQKRGGNRERVPLEDVLIEFDGRNTAVLDLDGALRELAALSERQGEVVARRFFGGLSVKEIAEQLEVSVSTVENDLRIARAWLRSRLGDGTDAG